MTRKTQSVPEVQQLRALLTMSRELMQVDEGLAVLALAGRGMAELGQVDDALLVIRGKANESVSFDRTGKPYKADRRHDWHRMALERLQGGSCASSMPAARTMLVCVPAQHAMAVLVAGWSEDAEPDAWNERRRILETILELAVATLGRISTRTSLEDLVSTQYEQMAGTAQAHADELARRDAADSDTRLLALTDVLTGLNNRRGFFVQAEHMFRLSRRNRVEGTVIYADIDGLKLVNDQLGHDTGDHLIRDAAAVLRESLRGSDVLARLGGDEFVAFALDDAHPRVILSRLTDNLHAFNLMQERPYQLSISAGAVRCNPDGDETLLDYVQLADREMYQHKRRCLH